MLRKLDEKYIWTQHSREKMRYYRLTESRIKRVIRYPLRIEKGIFEGAIACMQPAQSSALSEARPDLKSGRPAKPKNHSEIWTLYVLSKVQGKKKIKIITAWRYPGKSPARDPIPAEILREIRNLL